MILSHTEEYALRAVLYIAAVDPLAVRASQLARELSLPRQYLGKTLTALVAAGVLHSARGSNGGFRLARPASDIPLASITRAFRAPEPRRCLLGLGACGEHGECAVHQRWRAAATLITRFFDGTTIGDLIPPRPASALTPRTSPAP